jgi:hypothetical protein
MKVKIEGTKYSRDLNTMAILCTDPSVKMKYEQELAQYRENIRRDEEINTLKRDISEIKSMLQSLIKGQ